MKFKFSKLSFRPFFGLHANFFGMLLVVVSVVMVWRGVWNLMDLYLFPGSPVLSNIFSILFGLFLLYLPDEDIKELI